jgi:hypothetical protein
MFIDIENFLFLDSSLLMMSFDYQAIDVLEIANMLEQS